MNLLKSAGLVSVTALLASGNSAFSQNQAHKPNIIIILTDDMGYSDPGCYGGELHTPALDKLASEGVRLARFYNSAMCVCSRASLLTGNYWPKALPEFSKTQLLQEKLQQSGYRTALIGKWHLQGNPMDRGFDHFFGFLGGFGDHFTGSKDFRLDRQPFTAFGPDYYSSDTFTDRAIHFIQPERAGQEQQPFFLYLSYQAPHNPLQAPKDDILLHRGKYAAGWQAVREARFKRQKEMGIVPVDAKLPDYPQNLPPWESLSPEQQDLEDLRMGVYAAMVERMDKGIGRLLNALEESGADKNTLIFFMSDNGTDSFSKMDEVMLNQEKLPGDRGSNWQPGTGWAYASVTPWRLYKISQHAGGVTTGAIAWWPGNTGRPGRIEHTPLHMIDIVPTINELLKQNTEEGVAGESFMPLLSGNSWQRKKPLYFQFMDNRAIRTSEWTMVEVDEAGWELFRAGTDPLENENLVSQYPEIVDKLQDDWMKWWQRDSGEEVYQPKSTKEGPHYNPQGDRGTGILYVPTAMPVKLKDRYARP
jgi:arylsulfatase A-like enzyme